VLNHGCANAKSLSPDDVRLSDHPAHASTGRDDVRILKKIQGRRRKSSICHLAMPVAHFDGLLGTIPESLPGAATHFAPHSRVRSKLPPDKFAAPTKSLKRGMQMTHICLVLAASSVLALTFLIASLALP
jgi:hypothetical protein